MTYTDAQDLTFGQRYTVRRRRARRAGDGRAHRPTRSSVLARGGAPVAPPRLDGPARRQRRCASCGTRRRRSWTAPPAPGDLVLRHLPRQRVRRPRRPLLNLEPHHRPPVRRPRGPERRDPSLRRARAARGRRGPELAERGRDRHAGGRDPPAQPRGLVAVPRRTERPAWLWQAVADADVAGYLVYRSTTAGRGHARLTPAPQGTTTYVDTGRAARPDVLLRGHRGRSLEARQRVRARAAEASATLP